MHARHTIVAQRRVIEIAIEFSKVHGEVPRVEDSTRIGTMNHSKRTARGSPPA